MRKVWVHNGITEERIYLGGFEIYRRHENGGVVLERQTLHVMDGAQRIAMVETKTVDSSGPIANAVSRVRFQCSNHLGSSNLELDEAGLVISYEEYHPYGTSAYRATNGAIDVSAKRYRYTGKERDEETGLYYHGARYYACWLGRWTSADPAGMVDGVNLFRAMRDNPIRFEDPTGTDPALPNDTRTVEERNLSYSNPTGEVYAHAVAEGKISPDIRGATSEVPATSEEFQRGVQQYAIDVAATRVEQGRAPVVDYSDPAAVEQAIVGLAGYNAAKWNADEPIREAAAYWYGKGLSTRAEDQRMWHVMGGTGDAPIGFGYWGPRDAAEAGHSMGVHQVEMATFAVGSAKWLAGRALTANLARNRAILGGEAEISVAFKPLGQFGHNRVGIRLAGKSETQWFDMGTYGTPSGKPFPIVSPSGEFSIAKKPGVGYSVSSIPVAANRAELALAHAMTLQSRGRVWYVLGVRDCASSTRGVLSAAGIEAPITTFTPNATFQWFRSVGGP